MNLKTTTKELFSKAKEFNIAIWKVHIFGIAFANIFLSESSV